MNRTDRLYALAEELRSAAPGRRSANWLARRFEVSARTIERDISALQQSGVPIWADAGRTGGYTIDAARTLPPVNFTPDEAVAVALALRVADPGGPFAATGSAALRKLLAAMRPEDAEAAERLAGRVHVLGGDPDEPAGGPVPAALADAVRGGRVLRLSYTDREGRVTRREVEPVGYVRSSTAWYLLGWCRTRRALRAFRFDRVGSVSALAERAPQRRVELADIQVPNGDLRTLTLV